VGKQVTAYVKTAVFSNVDSLLTYSSEAAGTDSIGRRVAVPLGNKTATAVILEVSKTADIADEKIKPIRGFLDDSPVLNHELIKLGLWMADYYLCAPGLVFATMLAPLFKVTSHRIVHLLTEELELKGRQADVAEYLKDRDGLEATMGQLEKALKINGLSAVINAMEEKGIVSTEEKDRTKGIKRKKTMPETGDGGGKRELELNRDQAAAFKKITAAIDSGKYRTFLLFGATGSGKTEVYIRAALHAEAAGKKVIVLVPEIFLTPQVTERFKEAFSDRIAIYHSGLKQAERYHEWERMKNGEVDVVVGTRSAVFAPFDAPGLIIVDEEFDNSYKQENDPRYSARDTAVYRASLNNAVVVLGSATPSAESYNNALTGKYEMLRMPDRVSSRPMPVIEVVDLKTDANKNKDLFFSEKLLKDLRDAVDAGGQAILFINRRGFSSYNFCMECGHIEKCVNCDIPLVYHKSGSTLRCHYCGYEKRPELFCPECRKPLSYKGAGTQRLEEVITKFFPDKKIERIDMDSMRDRSRYFKVYNMIKNREIDILIGTQMISKGFDFPEVTFVGVVSIDAILNLPDFRSEERVFELLMQVAGRTGRGEKPGKVVIQTFNPSNPAIDMVKNYKTEEFYSQQLRLREELNYPPFGRMMQVIIQDVNEEKAFSDGEKSAEIINKTIKQLDLKGVDVLGPAEAPLSRLRNKYRVSIIVKSRDRKALNIIGKAVKKESKAMDVNVIVDPVNTL
jgi:primosomal protein N' (replication factor Y)